MKESETKREELKKESDKESLEYRLKRAALEGHESRRKADKISHSEKTKKTLEWIRDVVY